MSVQFVGSGNRVCILGNAVNAQGEIRSAAQGGFREVTISDGFLGIALVHSNRGTGGVIIESQVDGSGGNSLTVDGELAGIKHMQAAIFQGCFHFGNLLGSAFGNFGAKVSDGNSAFVVTLGPVGSRGMLPFWAPSISSL